MSDKRIIDLPTLQQALGNDAWLIVDIESGATYKIKKSALLGLQALETQSQEVYGAINEVRSLAEDLVSDEYSATSAYAKGDYCIYNNTLYKCTTAIGSGGEAWNSSHWSATKCDDELSELKQSLDDLAKTVTITTESGVTIFAQAVSAYANIVAGAIELQCTSSAYSWLTLGEISLPPKIASGDPIKCPCLKASDGSYCGMVSIYPSNHATYPKKIRLYPSQNLNNNSVAFTFAYKSV